MTEETKIAAPEVALQNSDPVAKPKKSAEKKTEETPKATAKKEASKIDTKPPLTEKKEAKGLKKDAKSEKFVKKANKKIKYTNPFSFEDELQAKFVNCIMKNGKKNVAQQILRKTFDEMNRRGVEEPLKTFELAIKNATPNMEVRAKRIGGAVYQIPIPVTEKRQASLSVRWILSGARKKKGIPMYKRLVAELMDCSKEAGYAFTKREDSHKMAQANRAFAHLARY